MVIGLVVALATLTVRPASAEVPDPDAGLVLGTANVGKVGSCDWNLGSTGGGGLGIGILSSSKRAYMVFDSRGLGAVMVNAQGATQGLGWLRLCVRLSPVLGIGASCDTSKGHDGFGVIQSASGRPVWLSEIGWKVATPVLYGPGQYILITGRARTDHASWGDGRFKADDAPAGSFLALAKLNGWLGCLTKGPAQEKPWNEGATAFLMVMAFTVLPASLPAPAEFPLLCKEGWERGCLYDPKW